MVVVVVVLLLLLLLLLLRTTFRTILVSLSLSLFQRIIKVQLLKQGH